MRSASICVLPEPAPASRRMFVSSSSWMSRRDSRSMARESDMCGKPPVWSELGIRELFSRLPVHLSAASRDVVAEFAVVLVWRSDELSLEDQVPQISKDGCDVNLSRRWDGHALQPSLVRGEVIDA